MATYKFIIKKNRLNQKGLTTIYLLYCHGTAKKELSTGEKIAPKYWDNKQGKPKPKYSEWVYLEQQLNKFEQKVKLIIRNASLQDIEPTPDYFKLEFNKKEQERSNIKKEYDFFEKFDEYRAYLKIHKSPSTGKNFNSLYKHLKAFEKRNALNLLLIILIIGFMIDSLVT